MQANLINRYTKYVHLQHIHKNEKYIPHQHLVSTYDLTMHESNEHKLPTYWVNQQGNRTLDCYDCAVCLLPHHHSHYLRNVVKMQMMRMTTMTWRAAVDGATHVLM
jgi:4-aminobutyrate aminotransferase-like enzyme